MKRNVIEPVYSSFVSAEQDAEKILKRLFVQCQPYSSYLKKLLLINAPDCLDDNEKYEKIVNQYSVKNLVDEGYIRLSPKIKLPEFPITKSYIIITFDSFTPSASNPEFRDCTVNFDILCPSDCWDVGNFAQRPLKIMGYIDGLLNKQKLSGIGKFHFAGANLLILDNEISGYSLSFRAVHGTDDEEKKGYLVNA